ncbi:hypothetical protein AV530_014226 [Patagioenas fasciata monilis]|uniref:Uncharacterized protein n=1 Tax=Patagioenas fasciata monilis TaxID=372326 RepID=A0A1V4JSI4_PATFA|nr:hypothetical protein AV530_014226 [Patagioenas fasciata monilis]
MAPAASLSSGHTVVASVVSLGLGTRAVSPGFVAGGARAHPCSEEPSVNFTLRLLDGDTEQPLVLSPGSAVRLEARVDFGAGTSLKVTPSLESLQVPGWAMVALQDFGILLGSWGWDRPCSSAAFPGEGTLHRETVGPLLVQKEKVPWYEGPCRTVKRFLLAGLALLGSALVAAALVGALLALAVATWHAGRRRGRRRARRQCPFQAELQSVVRALVPRELERGAEVGPDHGSRAHSSA